MFSLLLLSVIVLGMMVSTDTETRITSNYRDKQTSTFAAMAGLQEARDRIQPATHNIVAPTDLPSLTAANVIYVINPRGSETVAPWDMSSTYKDTELCQENVLGLTGTAGVPCTTMVPTSNTSWRTIVNNSLTSSAPWNLSTPLDVKWTRISKKSNNMTPSAVNGNGSAAPVVCWDGSHQIIRPAGYGSDCSPDGSLATLTLTAPGSGYTAIPTVTLAAPPTGGVQATAIAVTGLTPSGTVQSADVTAGGSSYATAPTVTLSGGGGTGATATATILAPGAPVTSVSLTSTGAQCYATAPAIAFSGGGGAGAAATSALTSAKSCIQGWTVSGSCNARKGDTVSGVGLIGGGGSAFSGTITFANGTGNVTSVSIQNPGTGYTATPTTIDFASGPPCGGLTLTANVGYRVQSVSLTAGGNSYTSAPAMSFASGAGTAAAAATAAATLGTPPAGAGQVIGITITSGGSAYTSAPTVSLTGGGGSGAAGTTTLGTTYTLTGLTISNPGKGYLNDPAVSITGGGGAGATAKSTIGRGANYGQIYLLTSLSSTPNGARTMMQMEAATPVMGWASTGALTVDGPNPILGALPNSNNFVIHGVDNNSCSEPPEPLHPAIAAYDDPDSPTVTSSVDQIIAALPRPDHYTGAGGTPSVVNVFGGLGETLGTPTGLKSFIDAVQEISTSYPNDPGSIDLGSPTSPAIDYVSGDVTLNGSHDGYGILVVTGTLHFGGNFNWHGTVIVVGDGIMDFNGGGNGMIIGTALVAKIWDNHTNKNLLQVNGSPGISWNGGGGNGILYDHCWATNMMNKVHYTPPPTTRPLKVLSLRTLPY